jgi:hypothetical protein
VTLADGDSAESVHTAAISPSREWIGWNLWNLMLITL